MADQKRSINIHGQFTGGGVCINCTQHTTGINCNVCSDGYYRPHNVRSLDGICIEIDFCPLFIMYTDFYKCGVIQNCEVLVKQKLSTESWCNYWNKKTKNSYLSKGFIHWWVGGFPHSLFLHFKSELKDFLLGVLLSLDPFLVVILFSSVAFLGFAASLQDGWPQLVLSLTCWPGLTSKNYKLYTLWRSHVILLLACFNEYYLLHFILFISHLSSQSGSPRRHTLIISYKHITLTHLILKTIKLPHTKTTRKLRGKISRVSLH